MLLRLLIILSVLLSPLARADQENALALLTETIELIRTGKTVPAYQLLKEAKKSANADSDEELLVTTQLGFGVLYIELTNFDKAENHLHKAYKNVKDLNDAELSLRIINQQVRLDIFSIQYLHAEKRIQHAKKLFAEIEQSDVYIETLLLTSEIQQRQGQLDLATESLQQAKKVANDLNSSFVQASINAQHASLLQSKTQYSASLTLWQRALTQFKILGYLNHATQAINAIGEIQSTLGLLEESKANFTLALKRYRKTANYTGELRALINLGNINIRLHKPQESINTSKQALIVSRKRHDYIVEAQALMQLGNIWLGEPIKDFIAIPNPPTAIRHIKAAQSIFKDAGDQNGLLDTYLLLAKAKMLTRKYRIASKFYEYAQNIAEKIYNENAVWLALYGQAQALKSQNKLKEAAEKFSKADSTLEKLYTNTSGLSSEVRSIFINDKRRFFEDYLQLILNLHRQYKKQSYLHKAFAITEAARSRQFTDMIANAGISKIAGKNNPRLTQLLDRENKLIPLIQNLQRASSSTLSDSNSNKLQALKSELANIQIELKRDFPRYNDLLKPREISVKDLQKSLHKNETILSYFTTRNALYVFIIDSNSFKVFPIIVKRKSLRKMVDRFRLPFTQINSINDLARWKPSSAALLYQTIFKPVEKHLKKNTLLYISADDALYTVPFEALLKTKPNKLNVKAKIAGKPMFSAYEELNWLGKHIQAIYIPSASALYYLRKYQPKKPVWTNKLLAFADPVFSQADTKGGLTEKRGLLNLAMSRATGITGLARLPETADEVNAVNKILGGENQIFLRQQANEKQVYDTNPITSRYVMFSTHGLLAGDFSGLAEPSLALTLSRTNNPREPDGFLTMSEILGLRMNSDLTVLSACNTAGEPEQARSGEGFAGLTRSFMFAGTQSLLVSHWSVGSQATVDLMTKFFTARASGKNKTTSLAKARSQLRSTVHDGVQLAHPFFWAPFVLVGNAR